MLEFQTEEGILRVMLQGEIDHHSAGQLREQIDCRLEELLPKRLILDFTGVTFMDSSGIGLVMGRVRQAAAYGGQGGDRSSCRSHPEGHAAVRH